MLRQDASLALRPPAPAAARAAVATLPPPLSSFVGREREQRRACGSCWPGTGWSR